MTPLNECHIGRDFSHYFIRKNTRGNVGKHPQLSCLLNRGIRQSLILVITGNLTVPIAQTTYLLYTTCELHYSFVQHFRGCVQIKVFVVILGTIVYQDTIKNPLTRGRVYFIGIGKAHFSQAKITYPDIAFICRAVLQINIYHIAIFMSDRNDELVLSGSTLVYIKGSASFVVQQLN